MKKIFYSLMTVALCSCAQSEVEDVVTPPQADSNGLKFTVVDNGFLNEDGTRVTYGEYGSETAYKATFEPGDKIGVYAIKTTDSNMELNNTYGGYELTDTTAYVVKNEMLTLGADGIWHSAKELDLTDATLLFAYAPYRENASIEGDHVPSFTKNADNSWAINKGNNRFFVGGNTYIDVTNNSTPDEFKANDWMGAVVNLSGTTGTEEMITLKMEHMRGMIELTTPVGVNLTDLTLKVGAYQYKYTPYIYNEKQTERTKNVYRILTTEYRSTTANTLCATIKDGAIEKKYQKELTKMAEKAVAGYCSQVNINYTPAQVIEVGKGTSLADLLNGTQPTSLHLTGELTANDLTTLASLTALTTLDMSELTNTSIPESWLLNSNIKKNLTTLILPNGLTTIETNALQVGADSKLTKIELPASVTTIGQGAFYWSPALSVRIPEDSQLKTVGQGAFYNTKAVYTYENNLNLLVLPQTLTDIGAGGAFSYVNQLRKVIFKGETLNITNNDDAFAGTNTIINVPADTRTAYEGKFPGKTVYIAGPTLTKDNYSSPYTYSNDGSIAGLCDGNTDNHWHSKYTESITYGEWGIYIDIALPEAYNNLKVLYATRSTSGAGAPVRVKIGVSNDGNTYSAVYTATDLPTTQNTKKVLDTSITATDNSSYQYVRFGILETKNGTAENTENTKVYANLGELILCQDAWTDPSK